MTEIREDDLAVSLEELPAVEVLCTWRSMDISTGGFDERIAGGFQEIEALATRHGHDPSVHRVIGVPEVADGRLVGYRCCAEVPAGTSTPDGPTTRLAGGRYAVLTLAKDPATIGATIQRFFAEYVPAHGLEIDPSRPGYEVYADRVMKLCTPIS